MNIIFGKKQYQNLAYKIKDETTAGDHAEIVTEIEVYDYAKTLEDADDYLKQHSDEFVGENGTTNEEKFMDYKIKKLKDTKEGIFNKLFIKYVSIILASSIITNSTLLLLYSFT